MTAASILVSCSETGEPLNARAGRIPPEELNEILRNRYAATDDIQEIKDTQTEILKQFDILDDKYY